MKMVIKSANHETRVERLLGAPLAEVANRQRLVPDEFIDSENRAMTTAFERYARPLVGAPLPNYVRLTV